MFTGGELSRIPLGPLLPIAGMIIVPSLLIGLAVGRWIIPAKPFWTPSVTCGPIKLGGTPASVTVTYELSGITSAQARSTPNSVTCDRLSGLLRSRE